MLKLACVPLTRQRNGKYCNNNVRRLALALCCCIFFANLAQESNIDNLFLFLQTQRCFQGIKRRNSAFQSSFRIYHWKHKLSPDPQLPHKNLRPKSSMELSTEGPGRTLPSSGATAPTSAADPPPAAAETPPFDVVTLIQMTVASVGIVANLTVILAFGTHRKLRGKIPNIFIINQVSCVFIVSFSTFAVVAGT